MTTLKVSCAACDTKILPATAERFGGMCAQCSKLSPDRLHVKRQIKNGTDPFVKSIELTQALIKDLAVSSEVRHIAAIADPMFEAVRFYTGEKIPLHFDYDELTEIGEKASDEIELYTLEIGHDYSLLKPVIEELKRISPKLNSAGKVAVAASWGMGPEEIGWMIRQINDRNLFEAYLDQSDLNESQINQFDDAYERKLN